MAGKADIKTGFWLAIGFLIAFALWGVASMVLGRAVGVHG